LVIMFSLKTINLIRLWGVPNQWTYRGGNRMRESIRRILHLERENQWKKDVDTIEKLFAKTDEGFVPHNVIGIQYIESEKRIKFLN
jgi:hypothetical protein